MDRNTVIKGLERCRDRIKDDLSQTDEPCNSCPYAVSGNVCSPWELYDDTIALLKEQEETIKELQNAYDYLQKQFFEAQDKLLKEQEAVEPIPPTDESDMWRCGNCKHQIFRCKHQRFCEMCGKAVKWDA